MKRKEGKENLTTINEWNTSITDRSIKELKLITKMRRFGGDGQFIVLIVTGSRSMTSPHGLVRP